MNGPYGSFVRQERGQVVIEFAFAVVLLLVMVLGLIDVGRAVWFSDTLSFATREGARYAIVNGASSGTQAQAAAVLAQVQTRAVGLPDAFVLSCPAAAVDYGVCVTWNPDKAIGSTVTVSASSKFTPLASRFFLGGALRIDLSASTTMIIQQ